MNERLPKDLSKWEKKTIIEDIGSPEEHGDPFWRKGNFGLEMDADGSWEAYAIVDGAPIKIKGDFMSSNEAIEFLNASICRKELVDQGEEREIEEIIEVEIMDDVPSFKEIMAKSMAAKYGNDFEKSSASTGITVNVDEVRGPEGTNTGASVVANPDDVRKSDDFPTFSQMFGRNLAKASDEDKEEEDESEDEEETTEESSEEETSEESSDDESDAPEEDDVVEEETSETDITDVADEDVGDDVPDEPVVEEETDITVEEPEVPETPAEPAPVATPKTEVSTWVGRTVSFSKVGKTGVIPAPQLAASAPPVAPPQATPNMPPAQPQATPAPAPAPAPVQEPAQMSSQGIGYDTNKLAPIPPVGSGVVQKATPGTFDDALEKAPKSFRDEMNRALITNRTRNGTSEGMVPFGSTESMMNMGSPVMQAQYLPGTVRMNYMGPSNMTFPNDRLQSRQG